jgi:glycosyltransferase involved in cell wall biosynthesis
MSFFSIIIPTYNRSDKLNKALASIKKQTCKDFEVIVCDDGSTDCSKAMVGKFSKEFPIVYSREDNSGGPARPRNNGLKLAKGKWVCFLDDDDWWYPDKLETIKKYTPSADVIYHALDVFTPGGRKFFKEKSRNLKKPCFSDLMINGNALNNSSVCVNVSILKKVGWVSEEKELIGGEDYDMWLRLSRVTERFRYIPVSLGAYWQDGKNITVLSEKYIELITYIFEKFKHYLSEKECVQANGFLSYMKAKVAVREREYDKSVSWFRQAIGSGNEHIRLRAQILFCFYGFRSMLDRLNRLITCKN